MKIHITPIYDIGKHFANGCSCSPTENDSGKIVHNLFGKPEHFEWHGMPQGGKKWCEEVEEGGYFLNAQQEQDRGIQRTEDLKKIIDTGGQVAS